MPIEYVGGTDTPHVPRGGKRLTSLARMIVCGWPNASSSIENCSISYEPIEAPTLAMVVAFNQSVRENEWFDEPMSLKESTDCFRNLKAKRIP